MDRGGEGAVESQREILERMATRLASSGDDSPSFALGDGAAIAAAGRKGGPRIHEHDGYRVVLQGDLRLASLGGERDASDTQDPIAALLKTYRERGERVLPERSFRWRSD